MRTILSHSSPTTTLPHPHEKGKTDIRNIFAMPADREEVSSLAGGNLTPTDITFDNDATSTLIVEEIRATVHPLNQYSDDEEEISKVIAYSLLALLWEKDAPEDNIDYQNITEPHNLGYDDPLVLETFYYEQERVCTLIWNLTRDIIRFYGIPQTAEALIENMEIFPPAWYLAARWKEAEKEYGPNPKGITLTEDPHTKEFTLTVES